MSSQPPSTNQLQFAPFSSSLHPAFWTTFAKYKLEVLGLDSDPVDVKVSHYLHSFRFKILRSIFFLFILDFFIGNAASISIDFFQGVYVNDDVKGLPASLSLDWSAFAKVQDQKEESDFKLDWNEFHAPGQIMNKNTLEEFKQCDKKVRYGRKRFPAKETEWKRRDTNTLSLPLLKALLDEEGSKLWGLIKSGEAIKRPQVLTKFIALTFADLKKYNFYYWFVFPALTLPGTESSLLSSGPENQLLL